MTKPITAWMTVREEFNLVLPKPGNHLHHLDHVNDHEGCPCKVDEFASKRAEQSIFHWGLVPLGREPSENSITMLEELSRKYPAQGMQSPATWKQLCSRSPLYLSPVT